MQTSCKTQNEACVAATYETLLVKFSEPISNLSSIFDDPEEWGVSTLKEWVESYESTRFTQIGSHTAVITSEYNMEYVADWLRSETPIAEAIEF